MIPKIGVLIFTRISSKRLKNKAIIKLNQLTLIQNVINISKLIKADQIILCTSINFSDDIFEKICEENEINIYRGSLENVAERTVGCIKKFRLDYFIRINGDSPIIPYRILNNLISKDYYKYDFITNIIERNYIHGYSIEIFNAKLFVNESNDFQTKHLEHITSYFYENYFRYKYQKLNPKVEYKGNIRLTIDTQEDLNFMKNLLAKYSNFQFLDYEEIIKLIKYEEKNDLLY